MRRPLFRIVWLLLCLALLVACGGRRPEPFVGRNLQGGEGIRMAILPFDNLTNNQGAGKTMESLVLVEFLKRSPTRILDPGEVNAALLQERVRLATSIPRETVKTIGQSLGADLLLVGVVHEFVMQRVSGAGGTGEIPIVSLTLRILNAATGEIVWAASSARRGNDTEKVFGIGRIDSVDQLAQAMAQEMAEAFAVSLRRQ